MAIKNIKTVTYRSHSRANEPIPSIIISGLHLQQYGFQVGQRVSVEYGRDFVHISRIIRDMWKGSDSAAVAVR